MNKGKGEKGRSGERCKMRKKNRGKWLNKEKRKEEVMENEETEKDVASKRRKKGNRYEDNEG